MRIKAVLEHGNLWRFWFGDEVVSMYAATDPLIYLEWRMLK